MFLLFFALASLGTGIFTTYVGDGKSRFIGVMLIAISTLVFLILGVLLMDDVSDTSIDPEVFVGALVSVVGTLAGIGIALGLVLAPMLLKRKETIDEIDSLAKVEDISALEEIPETEGTKKAEDPGVGPEDKEPDQKTKSESTKEAPGDESGLPLREEEKVPEPGSSDGIVSQVEAMKQEDEPSDLAKDDPPKDAESKESRGPQEGGA